jgi:hypothetical protein
MKPKKNYKDTALDNCYTPDYALDPLLPFLPIENIIWECAVGEGHLHRALLEEGYGTLGTGLTTGQDFFTYTPRSWDMIVTNPPFSLKYQWIERCYDLGKPFALLLPLETLGACTSQAMFEEYGIEVLLLNKRVNFYMPNKGWDSAAQFPVAWFCWHILPRQIVYGKVDPAKIRRQKQKGKEL